MPQYTIQKTLDFAREKIEKVLGEKTDLSALRYTPGDVQGDIAFPCFPLAKALSKNPNLISKETAEKITFSESDLIEKCESSGGYINFFINYANFCESVITDYLSLKERYGSSQMFEGKTAVIDYSSPNIAKPFSIGHLRSTNIGAALYLILSFSGCKVIGDNHIGDWGTQFGKLIYAYKKWGKKEEIEKDPIKEFLRLYVQFHDEAGLKGDEQPETAGDQPNPMEEEARRYFKMLEDGDPEITKLWEWIRALSLKDFQRVYDKLGVKFDEVLGEYFYNDKMDEIRNLAEQKNLTHTDPDGTMLIRLDDYGINTPLLIRKKDGASLYATRDLACILYRKRKWNPDMILYVVGEEQTLYFKQIIKTKELLGIENYCEHIQFGLMVLPEGKVSTRKGNVIFLEDVLEEAKDRVKKLLEARDFTSEEKEKIAEIVGIGAVKYHDLSQNRKKSITFEWEKLLSLDGNSSPYLQYSYSRAKSIIRKSNTINPSVWHKEIDLTGEEIVLLKKLARFPETVESAATQLYPHIIAAYLFELAQDFTSFYSNVKVIGEEHNIMENRLLLTSFYACVVKTGLGLLGIGVVEEM